MSNTRQNPKFFKGCIIWKQIGIFVDALGGPQYFVKLWCP